MQQEYTSSRLLLTEMDSGELCSSSHRNFRVNMREGPHGFGLTLTGHVQIHRHFDIELFVSMVRNIFHH